MKLNCLIPRNFGVLSIKFNDNDQKFSNQLVLLNLIDGKKIEKFSFKNKNEID